MAGSGSLNHVVDPSSHDSMTAVTTKGYTFPGSSYQDHGSSSVSSSFTHPLESQARNAKVKHLAETHPAIVRSRVVNETLIHVQQTLRNIAGIGSREAEELIDELRNTGQLVTQELSQLVDALLHMKLDVDDTKHSISKVTLGASLLKAKAQDQDEKIASLTKQLENTRAELLEQQRLAGQAVDGKDKVVAELTEINKEWHDRLDRRRRNQDGVYDSDSSNQSSDVIKRLQNVIDRLEDHVNSSTPERPLASVDVAATTDMEGEHATHGGFATPSAKHLKDWAMRNGDHAHHDTDPSTTIQPFEQRQPFFSHPQQRLPSWDRPATAAPPSHQHSSWALGMPLPVQRPPSRAPSRFATFANPRTNQPPRPTSSAPMHMSLSGRSPPGAGGGHQQSRMMNGAFSPPGPAPPPTQSLGPSQMQLRDYYPPPYMNSWSNGASLAQHQQRGWGPTSNHGPPSYPPSSDHRAHAGAPHARPRGPAKADHHLPAGGHITISNATLSAWRDQFGALYDEIRNFVNAHAVVRDRGGADRLRGGEPHVWDALVQCYHPLGDDEAASYIHFHLNNEVAKPCLVTRMIINFVVKHVWTPTAWKGFDAESTFALVEVKGQLDGSKCQPSYHQQALLDRLAAIVESIRKQDTAGTFHTRQVNGLAAAIARHICPTLDGPHTQAGDSFGSSSGGSGSIPTDPVEHYARLLQPVAHVAWTLSAKILSSRLTFDFRFPDIGSRFSQQSMLAIWPDLNGSELQAKHWRIALVTTPVITCRNDTGGNISAHSVAMADVYCMQ